MMNFFKNLQKRGIQRSQENAQSDKSEQRSGAHSIISTEKIKCTADIDLDALQRVHNAFHKLNRYTPTYAESTMDLAVSINAVDVNLYNLCEALADQNYMLMRKIDELSDRLAHIEESINSSQL